MKSNLVKLLLIATVFACGFASAADIGPQTDVCATNMYDLKKDIRNHFLRGFRDANITDRFVGSWTKSGDILGVSTFSITDSQEFPYVVCPQHDGSFFVYNPKDKAESGIFKLTSKDKAVVSAGTKTFAQANGEWNRGSTAVADRYPGDRTRNAY